MRKGMGVGGCGGGDFFTSNTNKTSLLDFLKIIK